MKFKERMKIAYESYLSVEGRIFIFILSINLFLMPSQLFSIDFDNNITNLFLKIILTNLIAWMFIIISCLIFWLLISLVFGLIAWILTGELWFYSELLWQFPTKIFVFSESIYFIVFGKYENKWYFLKEWFQKDKIAKELLGEK